MRRRAPGDRFTGGHWSLLLCSSYRVGFFSFDCYHVPYLTVCRIELTGAKRPPTRASHRAPRYFPFLLRFFFFLTLIPLGQLIMWRCVANAAVLLAICECAVHVGGFSDSRLHLFSQSETIPDVSSLDMSLLHPTAALCPAAFIFYDPMCGHCQGFAPLASRFAASSAAMASPLLFAGISCAANSALCYRANVTSVPVLAWMQPAGRSVDQLLGDFLRKPLPTPSTTLVPQMRAWLPPPTVAANVGGVAANIFGALQNSLKRPPATEAPQSSAAATTSLGVPSTNGTAAAPATNARGGSRAIASSTTTTGHDAKRATGLRTSARTFDEALLLSRLQRLSREDLPAVLTTIHSQLTISGQVRSACVSLKQFLVAARQRQIADEAQQLAEAAKNAPPVAPFVQQHSVKLADLAGAFAITMAHEVAMTPLTARSRQALLRFLDVIHASIPSLHASKLKRILQDDAQISPEQWERAVTQYAHIPYEGTSVITPEYHACKGSRPVLRGFTCGMWHLYHATLSNAPKGTARRALGAIREYVLHFFLCGECRMHFSKFVLAIPEDETDDRKSVLWLWRAHNAVNERLKDAPSRDPFVPKVAFPPKGLCEECSSATTSSKKDSALSGNQPSQDHHVSGAAVAFNEDEVLRYLRERYHKFAPQITEADDQGATLSKGEQAVRSAETRSNVELRRGDHHAGSSARQGPSFAAEGRGSGEQGSGMRPASPGEPTVADRPGGATHQAPTLARAEGVVSLLQHQVPVGKKDGTGASSAQRKGGTKAAALLRLGATTGSRGSNGTPNSDGRDDRGEEGGAKRNGGGDRVAEVRGFSEAAGWTVWQFFVTLLALGACCIIVAFLALRSLPMKRGISYRDSPTASMAGSSSSSTLPLSPPLQNGGGFFKKRRVNATGYAV